MPLDLDVALPPRFADASFASYRPETPSQAEALQAAKHFVKQLQQSSDWKTRLRRWFGDGAAPVDSYGLYLVGPVGTGKTHLLAAMYRALHPTFPCAFLHSSALFRSTAPPQAFAEALAAAYRVLCLDEVELDDPANEARLVQILRALPALGVTLLATSNVNPDAFLSQAFGTDRFQRFLREEFQRRYRVVFVGGDDYRRRLPTNGHAWVGPLEVANTALRQAFAQARGRACWLTFDELLDATLHTAHLRLVERLARHDALFLAGIRIADTNDALRLLRVIDDLYLRPDAPTLFFSAARPPEAWFEVEAQHGVVEQGIAEKFKRTTSRLRALCTIEEVSAPPAPDR